MPVLYIRNETNSGWYAFGGAQGGVGAQGYQGSSGATGPQGAQGITGTGTQGSQGATGATGPQGPVGAQGAQGQSGAQGSAGAQGASGSQGFQGVGGTNGSQGAQGVAGPQGSAGAQGGNGAQGFQGSPGAVGATGLNFRGNWSSATAYVQNDAVVQAGTTYICVAANTNQVPPNATYWSILSLQGTQGSTGAQGTTGAQGNQGASGVQGATGLQGSQGAAGTTGAQGAAGPQGAQGATGFQGATGSQGSQGALGNTGGTGPQGAQGSAGSQGATGSQGSQGATGLAGAQGSVGAQGVSGAMGVQGSTGPQGAQGLLGSVLASAVSVNAGGYFNSGKTSPTDLTSGFYLGNVGGVGKFSIGDAAKSLVWDGANLTLAGKLILNSNIANGAVGTLQMEANAVTVVASSGNITSQVLSTSTSTGIKTLDSGALCTITSTGAPVTIICQVYVNFASYNTAVVSYNGLATLRMDGTNLAWPNSAQATCSGLFIAKNGFAGSPQKTSEGTMLIAFTHTPPAGTHTYSIISQSEAYDSSGYPCSWWTSGSSARFQMINSMIVQENKV